LPATKLRVGIDRDLVTLSDVSVREPPHSIVDIGNTASVARKLMSLVPKGRIIIRNYTRTSQNCSGWYLAAHSYSGTTGLAIRLYPSEERIMFRRWVLVLHWSYE
jgi:hypothetical protein